MMKLQKWTVKRTVKGQSRDSQGTPNKSVKSVKSVKKKEIINDLEATASIEKIKYGNKEINEMLLALKKSVGIEDFADSQKWARIYGRHCLFLSAKIGKDEFKRRLDTILNDDFKSKNCNRIKFLYEEIKGFKIINMSEADTLINFLEENKKERVLNRIKEFKMNLSRSPSSKEIKNIINSN